MTDILDRARKHLQQMSPHVSSRTSAKLLEELVQENANLLARVQEFDRCINRIATELGGVCCGGVDGDQSDPGSTTAVIVDAIRKLKVGGSCACVA